SQPAHCNSSSDLPFLEPETPQGTEDDDARHMESPTGESVLSHLCFAHGVEEELEIPRCAGQGAEKVIRRHRDGHGSCGLTLRIGIGASLAIPFLTRGKILESGLVLKI